MRVECLHLLANHLLNVHAKALMGDYAESIIRMYSDDVEEDDDEEDTDEEDTDEEDTDEDEDMESSSDESDEGDEEMESSSSSSSSSNNSSSEDSSVQPRRRRHTTTPAEWGQQVNHVRSQNGTCLQCRVMSKAIQQATRAEVAIARSRRRVQLLLQLEQRQPRLMIQQTSRICWNALRRTNDNNIWYNPNVVNSRKQINGTSIKAVHRFVNSCLVSLPTREHVGADPSPGPVERDIVSARARKMCKGKCQGNETVVDGESNFCGRCKHLLDRSSDNHPQNRCPSCLKPYADKKIDDPKLIGQPCRTCQVQWQLLNHGTEVRIEKENERLRILQQQGTTQPRQQLLEAGMLIPPGLAGDPDMLLPSDLNKLRRRAPCNKNIKAAQIVVARKQQKAMQEMVAQQASRKRRAKDDDDGEDDEDQHKRRRYEEEDEEEDEDEQDEDEEEEEQQDQEQDTTTVDYTVCYRWFNTIIITRFNNLRWHGMNFTTDGNHTVLVLRQPPNGQTHSHVTIINYHLEIREEAVSCWASIIAWKDRRGKRHILYIDSWLQMPPEQDSKTGQRQARNAKKLTNHHIKGYLDAVAPDSTDAPVINLAIMDKIDDPETAANWTLMVTAKIAHDQHLCIQ